MKNIIRALSCIAVSALILSSCGSTNGTLNLRAAYPEMYKEPLTTLLVMPPINNTNKVEAKDFFFTTLSQPLNERGYYVIPPYLSMEIFKNESAYDSGISIDRPVDKFRDYFGADMVLFTVINKWEKAALLGNITVEVEYILKSAKTNAVIYNRKGNMTINTKANVSGAGLLGALVSVAATAIATASTGHVNAARACNAFALSNLPSGKYSPAYRTDSTSIAGQKEFKATVNSAKW